MMKLYSYWRSSAAFRVRCALNLKGLDYDIVPVNIAPKFSEHTKPDYLEINPEGRVPTLETKNGKLWQSMAIIEWLDETYPEPPLWPANALTRAKARSFANTIACDIHPLNNLSVLRALKSQFDADQDKIDSWYIGWIERGFSPLETMASASTTKFLFAETPGIAETFLIPQIWNARRFNVNMSAYPKLSAIEKKCYELPAFVNAKPENQPDAQ